MGTQISVDVHPDPHTFRLIEFPAGGTGPFVSLRLGDVSLLVSDPAVLDALISLFARGQMWLTAALSGDTTAADPDHAPAAPRSTAA